MSKFLLRIDIAPYSGEYEVDIQRFTNRDYHDIKRLADCTPPEIMTALERGDMDIVVALSVIALRKSGRFAKIDENLIWDATIDSFDTAPLPGEDEDDADPPTILTEPVTPSKLTGGPSPIDGDNQAAPSLAATGLDSSQS